VCEPYGATVSIEATIGYAQPDLSHPAAPIVPTLRTTFPGAARGRVGAHRHGLV
jgi:hypothetical protein